MNVTSLTDVIVISCILFVLVLISKRYIDISYVSGVIVNGVDISWVFITINSL